MCVVSARANSLALSSTIGRVTKRTDEQRDVIVLWLFADLKDDTHLRIKTFGIECREIRVSIKDKPISPRRERLLKQEKRLHASLIIRPGMRQRFPCFVVILTLKIDGDAVRGLSSRRIKNVR